MVVKVVGWQEVTVPAGTFRALKIEGDGTWTAVLPSNLVVARGRATNGADVAVSSQQGARITSGRFFKAFWYVPAVHRWVKSEEDFYDNNGVRNQRMTSDLEAYTAADPAAEPPVSEAPAKVAAPRPRHVKVHRAKPPAVPIPKTSVPSLQETHLIGPSVSRS